MASGESRCLAGEKRMSAAGHTYHDTRLPARQVVPAAPVRQPTNQSPYAKSSVDWEPAQHNIIFDKNLVSRTVGDDYA